jgi:hypothetical protein
MAMTLITNSADTDSTDLSSIAFTSSIDSTYKLYIFKFINIGPATNNTAFQVQFNAASQSGYNEVITSTQFRANSANGTISYQAGSDQAQGSSYQTLETALGNASVESLSGTMWLFNPSDTTYVKHFFSTVSGFGETAGELNGYMGGYINTTGAITGVSFKMDSGNFDGTIKMYGVG